MNLLEVFCEKKVHAHLRIYIYIHTHIQKHHGDEKFGAAATDFGRNYLFERIMGKSVANITFSLASFVPRWDKGRNSHVVRTVIFN